jgi:cellulose synthase/poly-beta-1,6-N-acetylglucosamine synthase-like glycosyltransferase
MFSLSVHLATMISLLITPVVVLMLGMIVFQAFYVWGYQEFLSTGGATDRSLAHDTDKADPSEAAAAYSPPAAIILCLKGADDGLAECLTGIIGQTYPDFRLDIVIHSQNDPAAQAVEGFFDSLTFKPTIHFLDSPSADCSLKCSAISQALRTLPRRIEVVAFIDDDAIVDQDWLSDLVMPLADKDVGATTGNRWYTPSDASLGAWVRRIWNAAAVVQMQRYDIPWGGSLAIRKDTIDRGDLLNQWERSFCEDTSLTPVLRQLNLRLHRVPNLIVENKETCSLAGTFHWISRQLLTVRLHHRAWPLVQLHGIATAGASIVVPLLTVWLFWSGATGHAWTLLQTMVVYQMANFVMLFLIGRSNRMAINQRDNHNRRESSPARNLGTHLVATFLTQVVQPLALWNASSIKKVNWRGAIYKIKAGRTVKLLEVDGREIASGGPDARRDGAADTDSAVASVVSPND